MYELQFLASLGLTIGIELSAATTMKVVAARWLTKESQEKTKANQRSKNSIRKIKESLAVMPLPKFMVLVAFSTILTLPTIWFFFPALIENRTLYVLVSELWAWIVEALFYYFAFSFSFRQSLFFSGFLNMVSFGVGWMI